MPLGGGMPGVPPCRIRFGGVAAGIPPNHIHFTLQRNGLKVQHNPAQRHRLGWNVHTPVVAP
jgi:hypothetical protein